MSSIAKYEEKVNTSGVAKSYEQEVELEAEKKVMLEKVFAAYEENIRHEYNELGMNAHRVCGQLNEESASLLNQRDAAYAQSNQLQVNLKNACDQLTWVQNEHTKMAEQAEKTAFCLS